MGTVPEDICLLSSLETFITSANDLLGRFPSCFGNLSNLQEIHINANLFSGNLPSGLHKLPNLTRLTLSSNAFSGRVNSLFSQVETGDVVFPSLQALNLDSNGLGGTIPDTQLADIGSLKALTIDNNPGLSGSLNSVCTESNAFLVTADCSKVSCTCCGNCFF